MQQGGFVGHSMYHPKIVTILKSLELDAIRRGIFTRTNFTVGEFTVHKSGEKRKCGQCRCVIDFGERYGVKVQIGKKRLGTSRRNVYSQSTLCLPCLLEKVGIDDFDI